MNSSIALSKKRVSKARGSPRGTQMPSPRTVMKLWIPHLRDWQHEQMPRGCPGGGDGHCWNWLMHYSSSMTSSRRPKAHAYVYILRNLGKGQRSYTTSERGGERINVYSLLHYTIYQQANEGAFGCEVGPLWFLIRHVQALNRGIGWGRPWRQPRVNPPRPSGDWGVLRGPSGSQTSFPQVKWESTAALSAAGKS